MNSLPGISVSPSLLFIEKWVTAGASCSIEVDCHVGIVHAFFSSSSSEVEIQFSFVKVCVYVFFFFFLVITTSGPVLLMTMSKKKGHFLFSVIKECPSACAPLWEAKQWKRGLSLKVRIALHIKPSLKTEILDFVSRWEINPDLILRWGNEASQYKIGQRCNWDAAGQSAS